jgi:protein tyrosine/serine phosphatase
MKNFFKVDHKLYRSARPGKHDFRELLEHGIQEVLNLRWYHSHRTRHLRHARAAGLKLHRIASKASKINVHQLIEALRVIRDAKGPILVHCWHGSDRTGAVIAMYRIVFQGVSKEEAIEEMTRGGFGFHGKSFPNIVETILGIDIGYVRRELGMA